MWRRSTYCGSRAVICNLESCLRAKQYSRHAYKIVSNQTSKCRKLTTSSSWNASSNQDLLYNSPAPTDLFQSRLPRLPIPKLEDTCRRYLQSLKVAATDTQYRNTEKSVNIFQHGIGKTLQEELIARDEKNPHTNYVAEYWNDMYLKARIPLLHNFNVCIGLRGDPRPEYQKPVLKATNFVVAMCKFMQALEQQTLEPYGVPARPNDANKHFIRYLAHKCCEDSTKLKTVTPICMSQFKNIFKSTRVPRDIRDELVIYPESRHFVIMRKGHFYQIEAINENGDIRPAESILSDMQAVYDDYIEKPNIPLAVLTAGDRDQWKATRDKLIEAGNAESLKAIDSAIIMIALDEDNGENLVASRRASLQGNCYNRWFDKPLTIVIADNGESSIFMEHSWGDGLSALYPFASAWRETVTNPSVHPHSKPAERDLTKSVRRLEFNITSDVSSDIEKTVKWFNGACSTLNMQDFHFEHFGSDFIKKQRMSPDSFIQLGFQLAFYRLYGYAPSTYESCSTAIFRHGRTETMRPATAATHKVCRIINANTGNSAEDLRQAVRECSKLHGKLAVEAATGQGFDRHLFALRCLATDLGMEMPEIFTDESYAMMCNYVLSTSTVGENPAISLGCFAPVASDGYGIGYSVSKNSIDGIITSYDTRDCQGLINSLYQSLDQIARVLQN